MNKAVLVTGSSSGIGFASAVALAKYGFQVFACVRSAKDQNVLQAESTRIQAIIMDVTKPEQIQKAYDLISSQDFDSFHLVNNAGIALGGPVETLPLPELRQLFDVNFFGLVEVTQKFLPLILKNKGRIINISSVAGRTSSPFMGAYSASKFAVEAISDSLRRELAASGVAVVLIEPGPIATPIWNKGLDKNPDAERAFSDQQRARYKIPLQRFLKLIKKEVKGAISVDQVSEAILFSLTNDSPPIRLVVAASGAKVQNFLMRNLPQKLMDQAIQKALFR